MEHNTISEMRQIIDAIEHGEKVQFQQIGTISPDVWSNYDSATPNFFSFRYRIKPEEPKKKLRPFKDTAELFAVLGSMNGIWVKDKVDNEALLISGFLDNEVYITARGWRSVASIRYNYTFLDGTPCGVEEDA